MYSVQGSHDDCCLKQIEWIASIGWTQGILTQLASSAWWENAVFCVRNCSSVNSTSTALNSRSKPSRKSRRHQFLAYVTMTPTDTSWIIQMGRVSGNCISSWGESRLHLFIGRDKTGPTQFQVILVSFILSSLFENKEVTACCKSCWPLATFPSLSYLKWRHCCFLKRLWKMQIA